jgi:hypothetical protein
MRLILTVVFIVSITSKLLSQFNPGARQISLSNSDAALSNDVFTLFNNPAGLAQMNWREGGIFYSPAPFGFSELANGFFAYNEPFDFGSIAIGGMTYGFDLYRENKILVGVSYNYLDRFFAGVAFNYHSVSIKNYGSDAAFYLNAGGLIYITDFLRWGFYVSNLNRASFSRDDDQIPVTLLSGLSYDIIPDLSLNASVEKDLNFNASFLAGIDYNLIEYFSVRTGFSSQPSKYSAGVGINYSFINLDYALISHPDLGLTHQAGLIFTFGEPGNRNSKIREHLNLSN